MKWFEHLEGDASGTYRTTTGQPALAGVGGLRYLAGWPDAELWTRLLKDVCAERGIETIEMPKGLRLRETREFQFAFNYGPETAPYRGKEIKPAGVAWWPK